MKHIYEKQYDDQFVRKTYIYAKNADAYAYSDAATTVKINAATLEDLFQMGAIIVAGGVQYEPTSFELKTGVGTITYVTADGTTATTAVLATLKSSEYVAG